MRSAIDPIKILAGRFISLPPFVRMKVAGKMLRWREENQETEAGAKYQVSVSRSRQKSLLEQFWDEVEAAHGDGLYPINPFALGSSRALLYGVNDNSGQCPA